MKVGDDMAGRIPYKACAGFNLSPFVVGIVVISRIDNLNDGRRHPIENADSRALVFRHITARSDGTQCGRRIRSFHEIRTRGEDHQEEQESSENQALQSTVHGCLQETLAPVCLICVKKDSDICSCPYPQPALAKYMQPMSRNAPPALRWRLRAVRRKQVAANIA